MVNIIIAPCQRVLVDQLVSPEPGFIAQLKGRLDLYTVVTVFVDHFSRLKFIFFQETHTSQETLEVKHAFEAYCRQYECQVQHYHCDNCRFADNGWIADAAQRGQTISFYGINAHHQNGLD